MYAQLKPGVKKILISIGATLIAVNVLVVIFYNLYFKQDSLIKYFPVNTVAYLNISASAAVLDTPAIQRFLSETGLLQFFEQDNILNGFTGNAVSIGLVPVAENNVTHIEPLFVIDLNSTVGGDALIAYLYTEYGFLTKKINNNFLQRNLALISPSPEVLESVQDIIAQRSGSLADNPEVVLRLQGIQGARARGFIDLAALTKSGFDLQMRLTGSALSSVVGTKLFVKATVSPERTLMITGILGKRLSETPVVTDLLDHMRMPVDAYINSISPVTEITETISRIKNQDAAVYAELMRLAAFVEGTYQLDLIQDLLPLIRDNVEIASVGGQLVYAASVDGSSPEDSMTTVEHILREYLAVTYPLTSPFTLKDGTTGNEITKNYSGITVVQSYVDEIPITTLESERSFSAAVSQGRLYVSTSRKLLTDILAQESGSAEQKLYCGQNITGEQFIVSGEYLSNYLKGFRFIDHARVWTSAEEGLMHLCIQ